MSRKDLIIFNVHGNKKGTIYKYVGWTNGFNQGTTRWFSLGNIDSLLAINPNAIEIMKEKLKYFSREDNKEKVKEALLHSIQNQKILKTSKLAGNDLVENLLKKHNIFKSLKPTRAKNMEEIFNFLISKRLIDPSSILNSFNNVEEYSTNIFSSKNAFYRLLDIIFDSRDELLNSLNKMVEVETKRNLNEIYFDSTTVYFESFTRSGFRKPGYSKDGKFKEDQVVIAMACDSNGIPFHIKLFRGNIADANTMVPFIVEIEEKYKVKNLTVIADRGMSTNSNIRFLEQKNYNYIISYRAKATSKKFKEWVLEQSDYIEISESLKYKTQEYLSLYKNKRPNGKTRKRFITWSKSRAIKDRNDRELLIENFTKKQDRFGFVDSGKLLGSKKCKYFKEVAKLKFELDHEKVKKDQEFDGIYVYETNMLDLSPKQVIEKYSRQWNIETNFRSLKSFLEIRPVFVRLDEHILAHTLVCFASLVVLKLMVFKINNFYKEIGEINGITETDLIDILSKLRERVDINSETKEVIKREREDSNSIKDIWSIYDDIKKIVVKK